MNEYDVIVVGAGFAGLACAEAAALEGLKVLVIERKKRPGSGMHTTGILVKEVLSKYHFPDELLRKITGVRFYSPNDKYLEISSKDYFFAATDTPAVMKFLSDAAKESGVEIRYGTAFKTAEVKGGMIMLNDLAASGKFLIGADGAGSKVAEFFNLGKNKKNLLGVEVEAEDFPLPNKNSFYCYLSRKFARGYLGWIVPGCNNITQIGLATVYPAKPDIDFFLKKICSEFGVGKPKIVSRRGGLIPAGGVVKPFYRGNIILIGDAAGLVSPLTGGGIHSGLHYGKAAGEALADHLKNNAAHPAIVLKRIYPKFRKKLFLRFIFEYLAPDQLLNMLLNSMLFKMAAKKIFFTNKRY